MSRLTCVTPDGEIGKVSFRGQMMGNRGCLHGTGQTVKKQFVLGAPWIYCVTSFKNQYRSSLMPPAGYTTLFFWDEINALAAGHRPCFSCQRKRAFKFLESWRHANRNHRDTDEWSIDDLDRALHEERIDPDFRKTTFNSRIRGLPDGVMVLDDEGGFHLIWDRMLFEWTSKGYGPEKAIKENHIVTVLTPLPTVRTIIMGFKPVPYFNH
jgi:hypothetical protein